MGKYICPACDYIYSPESGDPENDIPQGTPFDDLPYHWQCPVCGARKEEFVPC